MSYAEKPLRWLPLCILVALATLYEPFRSNFNLANQSCEFFPTANQFLGTFFNAKHIVGYGLICLVALFTVRIDTVWQVLVGVLIFSALMELLQSFFVTGHCRAWDIVPNVIGTGIAAGLFYAIRARPKN